MTALVIKNKQKNMKKPICFSWIGSPKTLMKLLSILVRIEKEENEKKLKEILQ
jgi:hypothetical protein